MKLLLLASALVMLASEKSCRNNKSYDECFKGRLEIKANCMNYTISLIEGNMDTSLFVSGWTDESTGKQYKNVFELGSKCNFPANINAGDEFYFVIDTSANKDCAVCMMYYPVPGKSLQIRVIDSACKK
jgi:hypothetical protein